METVVVVSYWPGISMPGHWSRPSDHGHYIQSQYIAIKVPPRTQSHQDRPRSDFLLYTKRYPPRLSLSVYVWSLWWTRKFVELLSFIPCVSLYLRLTGYLADCEPVISTVIVLLDRQSGMCNDVMDMHDWVEKYTSLLYKLFPLLSLSVDLYVRLYMNVWMNSTKLAL